ncbi:uncharacterized protein METZ01_LOCUS397597, partial [marine metagenome]
WRVATKVDLPAPAGPTKYNSAV